MIYFGMNREMDEQSFRLFLQQFSNEQLLNALVPRMQEEDIDSIIELLTKTMQKHLSHEEYHQLFLGE